MARLPQPLIESMDMTWPEDYKIREDTFYKILGQAIRKRAADEKRKEGEKKEE